MLSEQLNPDSRGTVVGIPGQSAAVTTTIGAVAHVGACGGDVEGLVGVAEAGPEDCGWMGSIGRLTGSQG